MLVLTISIVFSKCVCVRVHVHVRALCFFFLCGKCPKPFSFFIGSVSSPASGGSVFFSVLIPHRNIVRLCDALCLLSFSQEVPQTPQVVAACFFLFSYITGILCVCVNALCLLSSSQEVPQTPQVVAACFFLFSYLTGILCVCVNALCLLSSSQEVPQTPQVVAASFFLFSYSHTSQKYCAYV